MRTLLVMLGISLCMTLWNLNTGMHVSAWWLTLPYLVYWMWTHADRKAKRRAKAAAHYGQYLPAYYHWL